MDKMIMFVMNEDNDLNMKQNFDIERAEFKKGELIQHEKLDGVHEVVAFDPATVVVKPLLVRQII